MRELVVILAFLAGMFGLFMSVCGGGFFVMLAYQSGPGAIPLLLIPSASIVCGVALSWACFRFIRRRSNQPRDSKGKR